MTTTVHVIPAKGYQIRDPDLKDLIPEEGRTVPFTDYWVRRLRDGDVFEAAPKPLPPVNPDAPMEVRESAGTGVVMTAVPPGTAITG